MTGHRWLGVGVLLLAGCGGGGGGDGGTPAAAGIAGEIRVPAGTAVDGDSNDILGYYLGNDDPKLPQALPNPVVLGGFVAAAPTGQAGTRFAASADPQDVYRLSLAPGQSLVLEIADHAEQPGVDLDLYLYPADAHDTPLASSLGWSAVEQVTLPAGAPAGDYDVIVQAAAGASSYRLSSAEAARPAAPGPGLEDEFVPGEALVRLRPWARAAGLRIKARGGDLALVALDTASAGRTRPPRALKDPRLARRFETLQAIKALRRQPGVAAVAPNYLRRPLWLPDDARYPQQWHYPLIQLPQAWDISRGSATVIVAVLDSGIVSHPDLDANVLGSGYDFVSSLIDSADGTGPDPDPSDPGGDAGYHGSHVAGTIAAATDNGQGVAGVAGGVRLMPVRVCGLRSCSSYDVMQGVRYAAGLATASGASPAAPAAIINLSLGGSGYSALEEQLFEEVKAAGVLVVAAAGNSGNGVASYPAGYPAVVSVTAVDRYRQRAWYANYGPSVDLAAPGGDATWDRDGDGLADGVLSTIRLGDGQPGYGVAQGTSMAAPHVAGVAALMKSVYPAMTATDFHAWLQAGQLSDDLGAAGRDDAYGHGLINALKAVRTAAVAAGGALPAILTTEPSTVDFGAFAEGRQLRVSNAGDTPLNGIAISTDQPWLRVAAVDVDAAGLGDYQLSAERALLSEGVHAATVTVTADNGSRLDLPVRLQTGVGAAAAGDAGVLYVLLADADTRATVHGLAVQASGGVYGFAFPRVTAGRYLLFAGSDLDGDGSICDAGEACTAWPDLAAPAAIEFDGSSLTGLVLESGFGGGSVPAASRAAARRPMAIQLGSETR